VAAHPALEVIRQSMIESYPTKLGPHSDPFAGIDQNLRTTKLSLFDRAIVEGMNSEGALLNGDAG
jgi:hypothetical protein